MSQIKIVFTGGGTAGHVTPNIALMDAIKLGAFDLRCEYIGSYNGIERSLIERAGIPFWGIASGKLRRELSLKNLLTPFKVWIGIVQAAFILAKIKPAVVFSKGGYVAFPVVFSAWLLRIPVILHESDFSPGLANRLSFPFAKKICVTFAKGKLFFKDQRKVVVTGTPVRRAIFSGDKARALALCGFTHDNLVLLIIGGSQGSERINREVRNALDELLKSFNIIHICGSGQSDPHYDRAGYRQFDYVHDELADLLALSDIVVSRAGANTLYELLCLAKPSLLIPLSRKASRGDQIENAGYFEAEGLARVLYEDHLSKDTLIKALNQLKNDFDVIGKKIKLLQLPDANHMIVDLLLEHIGELALSKRQL